MERWQRELIKGLFHYDSARCKRSLALSYKDTHIPRSLYKYRSFNDTHIDALKKGQLWMSSPGNLNDPHEAIVQYDPNMWVVDDLSANEFIAQQRQRRAAMESGKIWSPPPVKSPIGLKEWRIKVVQDVLQSAPEDNRDALASVFEDIFGGIVPQMQNMMSESFKSGFSILSFSACTDNTLL